MRADGRMPRIKICGLYRDCDIACVNEAAPDYAGFVFYPPSHRYVTEDEMRRFRGLLDPSVPAVGVFVQAPEETVARYLNEGLIQIAQLHGQEDNSYIDRLRKLTGGCEVWKAFCITGAGDLKNAADSTADRILLDNGFGTGKHFDWDLLASFDRPYILAGGLSPDNLADAISRFRPWGVDISSGVETDKKKDAEKIRQAITITRRMQL